jgi:phosphate transport system permease protein
LSTTTTTTTQPEVVWAQGVQSGAARDDRPRRPGKLRLSDIAVLGGAVAASLALTWLTYGAIAPVSGVIGFVICWYVMFVAIYWIAMRELEGPLIAADKTVSVVIGSIAIGLLIPLLAILFFVVSKGLHTLLAAGPHFFTQTQVSTGPLSKASDGGAAHAIVGTLEQVGLAILLSVPIGLATAVYMNEVGGRPVRWVRMFVNAMSGVPSIVAGLFIYAVWIIGLGNKFSGFSAALAISILMMPTVTRTAEEVLRLVPDGLREASLALGSPEWRTLWSVVLPTARSGLVTAIILGVARAIGETAPLIMTAFGSQAMNSDPFNNPQQSLPLFVWQQYLEQLPAPLARAWAGAMVLVCLVLILFTAARIISSSKRLAR